MISHAKSLSKLEGDIGRLGDFEDGLGVGALFPGGADGFDFGGVGLGGGVVDDQHLCAFAAGGFLLLALPLSVDVEDA
jgi:hypothetical protein